MNSSYILLWLESPLQSWGHDSKFGRRDTLNFPTKSGVLGLLCCALGAGGEQRELLARLSPLSQTVLSFVRTRMNSSNNSKPEKKSEREPLLRDFHMIGAGYDLSDPWQKLLEPYKSDGKPRGSDGGGTKMTYRYYLQGAFFAVVLEAPQDLAEAIAHALQNPVWDLYLGRRNCAPTDFIYRGLFPTPEAAQEQALSIAQEKKLAEEFRVLDGEHSGQGEPLVLNDVPIQFGERKQYRDRFVTVVNL